MEKEQLVEIARKYYSRPEIARYIAAYSKNREVVAKYYDRFGKRPDSIEYANDVRGLAEKNATSFHCSVELWQDPLALAKELSEEKLNSLRLGWDLLLDIDCPFLDYSKETARFLIKALEWHGIKSYGIKFSGNKGVHIILSHGAFPQTITYKGKNITIKDFFPTGPRLIASYLTAFIEKDLRDAILSLSSLDEIQKATGKERKDLMLDGKFNPYSIVSIDSILMSSRHLYRMPYSLHEKTGLASIVLSKAQLLAFKPSFARPSAVIIKKFLPEPEPEEARELLLNALDWQDKEKFILAEADAEAKLQIQRQEIKIRAEESERLKEAYCDCIANALAGIKQDGRKRALFVLITYFRALGLDFEKIERIIKEWNEKNYKPLREGYIKTQLEWFKKQTKIILPPNHEANIYYRDIGILGESCSQAKNPVTFTIKKLKALMQEEKEKVEKKGKRGRKKEEEKME